MATISSRSAKSVEALAVRGSEVGASCDPRTASRSGGSPNARGVFVAVHVLPQQGHLLVAFGHQCQAFLHDAVGVAAAFAAPREGHHAEGAHVVAAPHDGDKGGDAVAVEAHGHDLPIGLLAAQQHVHRALPGAHFVQQLRQAAVGVGAHHQVHHLFLHQQVFLHPLGHAAQDAHLQLLVAGLQAVHFVDALHHCVFRLLPHAARVQQHQVGLFGTAHRHIAFLGQDACHHLAVADVHLAAVALDIHLLAHGNRAAKVPN